MIEIPAVNAERVHGRARVLQEQVRDPRTRSVCAQGMRAAKARDPKLLKVLDLVANEIDHVAESQYGQTRRQMGTDFAERVEATEAQLWREAYRHADQGLIGIESPFAFLYGAAAEAAGLVT